MKNISTSTWTSILNTTYNRPQTKGTEKKTKKQEYANQNFMKRKRAGRGKSERDRERHCCIVLNLNAKMGATLALSHFVKLLYIHFSRLSFKVSFGFVCI